MAELKIILALFARIQAFVELVETARAEGRELTSEEIEEFRNRDYEADRALEEAIAQAKAEGR